MSVKRNLPIILERKQAILAGDPTLVKEQKAAGKLTARERITLLFDESSFVETDSLSSDAGVVTGYGTIDNNPVYVYAQDATVQGGAVGEKHANKVLKVMSLAEKTGAPLIAVLDSAGAKLDEGVAALNAYAMIAAKSTALSGVVPQITLVLGSCGGTLSALSQIADITIQSAAGRLFVNGPLVVSAATGKNADMNEIAGSDASLKSGAALLIKETDAECIALARKLVSMLPQNNLDEAVFAVNDDVNREIPEFNSIDKIFDIREIITAVADNSDFVELYADFAPSMVTGLAKIGGRTVAFCANQPSKDDGRLTVYGCKKAARLISFCDAFSIPVVSLVDSMGMKINGAPQGEPARAGASLLFAACENSSPRVCVITGQAIGMGYAALASRAAADIVYAWPGAVISAVSAQIAAQINYASEMDGAADPIKKRDELEQRYCDDVADGVNAAKLGYVDDVIEPAKTRQMIAAALEMLAGKRENKTAKKHGNMPL